MITNRITNFILRFIRYRRFKKNNCIIEKKVYINENTILEGNNRISANTHLFNCYIGFGSYTNRNVSFNNVKIGKYSCIASEVKVISGTHPTRTFVAMHPAFYSCAKQTGFTYVDQNLFNERLYIDDENKYVVEIGNDVWIGQGAILKGGIKIGDGAIVAMGAIVIKDVPPYAIVGGNPARIIRYRFNEDQINFLLRLRWWDKPESWINRNIIYFSNIESFINKIELK